MSLNPTRDDFAALLDQSMGGRDFMEGTVVRGDVVGIEKDFAIIDVGLKTEGRISLKEFGVGEGEAMAQMIDLWNPRCSPPWDDRELIVKVRNAYSYGKHPVGTAAPEVAFQSVAPRAGMNETVVRKTSQISDTLHPFDKLNQTHAFVVAGGGSHILWETVDSNGKPTRVGFKIEGDKKVRVAKTTGEVING